MQRLSLIFFLLLLNCSEKSNERQIKEKPIERVAVLSKTAIAFMEKLELLDKIVAVESRDFIYSEKMLSLIDSLYIPEVGGGSTLDMEKLIMLKPDLVFTFGTGSYHDDLPKLQAAGLRVVLMEEWKENNPLARLEWIKKIGALFGKKKEADSIFNETARRYDSLSVLAKNAKSKPLVLTGYPNGSEWAAGGGQSYFAKLLEDAGATYIFKDFPQTGIMNLNLEYALQHGVDADYWLHPSLWKSRAEILENEPRMEMLKLTIYQNSLRTNKKGAADFYESGIVQPDEILADLIAIFHPEILPERELMYYMKVE